MSKKQYQVTSPYVTVLTAGADGTRMIGLYRDHVLPDDVPAQQIKDLLEGNLIAEIGTPEAESVDPAEHPGARPDALKAAQDARDARTGEAPAKPKRDASKGDWEDYAVLSTAGTPGAMTADQAAELTKAELVERFR
jgi:hypothetical protein